MSTHPLIFVVGPTGVGKSSWALEMAKATSGVILNCDSVQTYEGLDIGTAKPTKAEQATVPHFMFDVTPPGGILTAGDYRKAVLPILSRELPKHPVYAVGGSGFYIQALEKGMFEIEKIEPTKEATIRARLESQTQAACYAELQKVDPVSAEDLNPNDTYRVQRALMIFYGLGRRLSDLKKEFRPQKLPYRLIKIGLTANRAALVKRIEMRAQQMLDHGLVNEVQGLIGKGLKSWPILQSVGYKQVLMYLDGELKEADLLREITLRTVQLSKRQTTWFQRDKEIRWFDITESAKAADWLRHELDSHV